MSSTGEFSGKVALVTGGANGIGLATARQFVEGGATVIIGDLKADDASRAASELASLGEKPATCQLDVADPEDVTAKIAGIAETHGRIDILVHSAGIGMEKSFLTTTPEEWRRLIDVDLSGTFFCGQAVARLMKANRFGRIVNLASTAGIKGGSDRAAYGAAKGGVIALTKVMAVELAPYGITVNALAPGAIETDLVKKMHTAETRRSYLSKIPLDRYGTPEETASAAVYLCSERAGYISGHILSIDGGFLAAGVVKPHIPDTD